MSIVFPKNNVKYYSLIFPILQEKFVYVMVLSVVVEAVSLSYLESHLSC